MEYNKENYNYLIGSGLKMDFNITEGSIDYFLPSGDELEYPLEMYYTRGGDIHDMDIITSAEDYERTLNVFHEWDYQIDTIGAIKIYKMRNFIDKLNKYVIQLSRKVNQLHNASATLVQTSCPGIESLHKDELDAVYKLSREMSEIIQEITKYIPQYTAKVYTRKKGVIPESCLEEELDTDLWE